MHWSSIVAMVFSCLALFGVLALAISFGISPGASNKRLYQNVHGVYEPVVTASNRSFDLGLVQSRFFVDGRRMYNGDRILLMHQHRPQENGIYVVGQPLRRAHDMRDSKQIIPGNRVFVLEGDQNGLKTFHVRINSQEVTLGLTEISFVPEIHNLVREPMKNNQMLVSSDRTKTHTRWIDMPGMLNVTSGKNTQIPIADTTEPGGLRFESDFYHTATGLHLPGGTEGAGAAIPPAGYVPIMVTVGGVPTQRYLHTYNAIPP